jgi:hypothetical protein
MAYRRWWDARWWWYSVSGQPASQSNARPRDEVEGRFICGIECDGVAYHSAESARDRDRLKQQVLEGLGWTLHRVWSTDWFKDPEGTVRRHVGKIEESRRKARERARGQAESAQHLRCLLLAMMSMLGHLLRLRPLILSPRRSLPSRVISSPV